MYITQSEADICISNPYEEESMFYGIIELDTEPNSLLGLSGNLDSGESMADRIEQEE